MVRKDWKAEHPPERTYLWRNVNERSICPPIPDGLSESVFRHMAEHRATSLLSPPAPIAILVSDSEAELESDAWLQPPEDEVSRQATPSRVAAPVDQTKLFGFGCALVGTFHEMVEFEYATRPDWWSDALDNVNGSRGHTNYPDRISMGTDRDQELRIGMEHYVMIRSICRTRNEMVDGVMVTLTPDTRPDLFGVGAAAVWSNTHATFTQPARIGASPLDWACATLERLIDPCPPRALRGNLCQS
jgi:hypothetical protein